ncbi:hypothetical protein I79_020550 [Cricetulus griseus]|uniref:Uncharacterized protein n=1 Tax=Cricetulus griseus TaxID=10029 RepID=G3IAD0_CRIGR|nr:hypothetical protein I79_020550 [Cricetulus griseus]
MIRLAQAVLWKSLLLLLSFCVQGSSMPPTSAVTFQRTSSCYIFISSSCPVLC